MAVRAPEDISTEDMVANELLAIIKELLEEVRQLRTDVDGAG